MARESVREDVFLFWQDIATYLLQSFKTNDYWFQLCVNKISIIGYLIHSNKFMYFKWSLNQNYEEF